MPESVRCCIEAGLQGPGYRPAPHSGAKVPEGEPPGIWYVLTDGGKSVAGMVSNQVRAEKNKGIRELEKKINSSALDSDGSLRYLSGGQSSDDGLLSDGWKVDFGV